MKREKRVDRRNNTLVAITSVVGIVIVSLAIMSYINSPEFSPSVQRDGAGNLGGIGSGGNVGGDLGPTNPNEWRVFLTNDTFSPNLGGIVGANGVCNLAAGRAGLDGRYVAWLSSSSKDAKGKINDGKYVRIDGVKIADSKSDLLDGTLDAAIEITEYGTGLEGDAQVPNVYTGTASDGSVIVGSNGYSTCGDWNSESSEDYAGVGILSETSGDWTNSFEGDCDYFSNVENAHLYCFEVSDIFKINSSNFIEPDFGGCKKYKVWTVQDLDNVRDDLKGCYTQMADINLDGIAFDPIGGLENPFTGVYDGNGFDIKNVNNLQIKEEFWSGETIQYVSLFAVSSGEIKNINLDVNIFNELSSQANQIFLESGLVLLNNGIIKNTKISGKVHGKISIDIDSVLGVAGFSIWNNGEISNSVYQGSVSANMNNSDWDEAVVGGIAVISEGIIRNSAFIGSVTCEIVEECGGLVGDNEGEISDSYFHGVLNGTNSLWLGGLAGTSSTGGNIQDS